MSSFYCTQIENIELYFLFLILLCLQRQISNYYVTVSRNLKKEKPGSNHTDVFLRVSSAAGGPKSQIATWMQMMQQMQGYCGSLWVKPAAHDACFPAGLQASCAAGFTV